MEDTILYLTEWMEASYQRRDFVQDDMCEFAEWYHQQREQERQGPSPDRDELAIEKSRYFLAFYVANIGAGHVTGCFSIETFGTGTFLSRIQAEKHVTKLVSGAWGIVFTGFQRLTKEEYEQWNSKL